MHSIGLIKVWEMRSVSCRKPGPSCVLKGLRHRARLYVKSNPCFGGRTERSQSIINARYVETISKIVLRAGGKQLEGSRRNGSPISVQIPESALSNIEIAGGYTRTSNIIVNMWSLDNGSRYLGSSNIASKSSKAEAYGRKCSESRERHGKRHRKQGQAWGQASKAEASAGEQVHTAIHDVSKS